MSYGGEGGGLQLLLLIINIQVYLLEYKILLKKYKLHTIA